ncbi:hypothetical protein OG311_06370 [Streptomyces sp. NBC_01343]|uniref:hypothetical protein n=1 Tax=Streptomyces sp. NBC_01343 TaxID=2903832 RepID=UPI002E0F6141|nr:hypothetical protein OG311_06370 [Streptomyces sp. NBC_01343]
MPSTPAGTTPPPSAPSCRARDGDGAADVLAIGSGHPLHRGPTADTPPTRRAGPRRAPPRPAGQA